MKRWQDWVNAVLGVALIASRWVLGVVQAGSAVILGALVAVLSLWATFTDSAVRNWMQVHRQRRSTAQ